MKKSIEQIKGQIELLGESSMLGYQLDVMDLQVFACKSDADTLWDTLTEENKDRVREMFEDDLAGLSYSDLIYSRWQEGMAVENFLEIDYNEYVSRTYENWQDNKLDKEVESALSDLEIENIDDIEE